MVAIIKQNRYDNKIIRITKNTSHGLKNALAENLQAHQEGKAIVTPSSKTD
jgi:hypothetical protein